MRRAWMMGLAWMASACVVPGFVPNADDPPDETDVDTDLPDEETDDTETDVETETDTALFEETDETEDTDDTTNPGATLNCHPFDPVSYTGWERKYRVTFPGSAGTETHTPQGLTPVPAVLSNPKWPQGYQTKQVVTGSASNNYTQNMWTTCDPAGLDKGIYEIGYTIGSGNQTLKANARDAQMYLPEERKFFAGFDPAWQVTKKRFTIKVPAVNIQTCPQTATGFREVTATYVGLGFEPLAVQGLGTVDAYKVNVILDQTQQVTGRDGAFQCQIAGTFFGAFLAPFQDLFGVFGYDAESGGFVTASIDRWYVRGVGLVKEDAVDYLTTAPLYNKVLTRCSGLPECP